MTLILALGNQAQVVQLSDRRISAAGRVLDDETGKAGVLTCPNARLAFGFTGLALYRGFNTFDWLVSTLTHAGPPDFSALNIIERLRSAASATFREHPVLRGLAPASKALAVMFSGYIYGGGYPQQAYCVLSNYLDPRTGYLFPAVQEEFVAEYFSADRVAENPTFIQRVGNWHGLGDDHLVRLRLMLLDRPPADAVINVASETLRQVADSPRSQNVIGKQQSSICIPPDPTQPVKTAYHSAFVQPAAFMPAMVWVSRETQSSISNIVVRPVKADTPATSVPVVHRKAPCPCGSRLRYGNCHGKRPTR